MKYQEKSYIVDDVEFDTDHKYSVFTHYNMYDGQIASLNKWKHFGRNKQVTTIAKLLQ